MDIKSCMKGLNPPTGHGWQDYDKTLYEISATEPDSAGNITYCLSPDRAGKVRAIWFDQVMSDWTDLPLRKQQNLPLTHRIDGYYVKGSDRFLIEFKNDGSLVRFDKGLCFKFHDSLTQLMSHGWITLGEAQQSLTYIVVKSGTPKSYTKDDFTEANFRKLDPIAKDQLLLAGGAPRCSDLVQRPWRFSITPECGLDGFEGISCRKVLTINVTQFDRYVQDFHWN